MSRIDKTLNHHFKDRYRVYVFFRRDKKDKDIARVSRVIEVDYDGFNRRNLTKEFHGRPISRKEDYRKLREVIAERCDCYADDISFMIHDPSICFDELGQMFPVEYYGREQRKAEIQ